MTIKKAGSREPRLRCDYLAFEDCEAALKAYDTLLERRDVYSATIAAPIESTDYSPGEQWLVVFLIRRRL